MAFYIGFEGLRVAYLGDRFELLLIKDMKMKGWRHTCAGHVGGPAFAGRQV
jgi:hypothetical protein